MRHRFARFIIYAAARPAMAATEACGVWVLMAARRKQSGNNSNRQSQSKSKSKSNCKSHASKYSAVAVYSGKQAKQLRQERQQTVCAVCCGSFKRVDDFCARIGTQQQQQANVQCATRNVPHAAGNGRRCGINQINGNCLKFALVYGLHGELASWLVSLPMLIAMECPHKDADAGHLRGLHATLPASPSPPPYSC